MFRRLLVMMVTAGLVASASTDLFACGDKFLKAGRGLRYKAYNAVHPSSILIYAPRWTEDGTKDFERFLKKAGHTPNAVRTASAMADALAKGEYDVVITSYSTIADVRTGVEALALRPALLPVLYKATNAQAEEARRAYPRLIRPESMTKFDALAEIDSLLDARSKRAAVTAAK